MSRTLGRRRNVLLWWSTPKRFDKGRIFNELASLRVVSRGRVVSSMPRVFGFSRVCALGGLNTWTETVGFERGVAGAGPAEGHAAVRGVRGAKKENNKSMLKP